MTAKPPSQAVPSPAVANKKRRPQHDATPKAATRPRGQGQGTDAARRVIPGNIGDV
jgi:hypothetical protein